MKTDQKIKKYKDLKAIREEATSKKQKIIFTTGCYDLLHIGHVVHFDFCKSQGDILVVSVANDKTVKILKGEDRPIHDEVSRVRLVAALECVDFAVTSEEYGKMDHDKFVELLKPDIFVLNDVDSAIPQKKALIERNGGKLLLHPEYYRGDERVATTDIITKTKDNGSR